MILSTNIRLKRIFPIVSLYMFFSNVLPMRIGELSYVYLLKKEENTAGTKSFASLIIGALADILVLIFAMLLVGCYLINYLIDRTRTILTYVKFYPNYEYKLIYIIVILTISFTIFIILLFIKRRKLTNQSPLSKGILKLKIKISQVINEIRSVKLDKRFSIIVLLSFLIILFRFLTQWYIVDCLDLAIGIWEFSFAILFSVLFSLIPIHGPAGIGTVEAPYVLSLVYLEVPKNDAITSAFILHILVMLFSVILGVYGIFNLKIFKKQNLSNVQN